MNAESTAGNGHPRILDRRQFLRLAAMAAVVSAAPLRLALPLVAARTHTIDYAGQLYRSTGSGRIDVSADGGLSWSRHSDLGDANSVTGLALDAQDRLAATVSYARWTFKLVLAPNRTAWLTT